MNFLSRKLQSWYHISKRDLPWRDTKNPYAIWLSEIILQQTQVVQGLPYFERFLDNFPTVTALADAEEAEVMRLWQGLGYYSRARNLHTTAKLIRDKFDGIFPDKYDDIRNLKGVGEYTAAAIASFAYNLPYAVVDGNVKRVISRLIGLELAIDSKEGLAIIKETSDKILDNEKPDQHNQAIMELGATVCKKASPLCEKCPFKENCKAFEFKLTGTIPFKTKKVKVQERHIVFFVIKGAEGLLMKKRNQNDIWKSLYDFPSIEVSENLDVEQILQLNILESLMQEGCMLLGQSQWIKHQLTHRRIWAKFVVLQKSDSEVPNFLVEEEKAQYFSNEKVEQLGKPILIVNFLKEKSKFNL